ncbi:Uncharacterised protein [Mycobacteroides abscessus subsp. abscessus]|nr:Uncharacterised protein [Mycobacteroides abscessus subsp. abscessus]
MTLTPSRFAHCRNNSPTPPAAACSSTVSPARSGWIRRSRYAVVSPRMVIAAAVSQEMPSGRPIRCAAGSTRSVL